MKHYFSLFSSHLELAHHWWGQLLSLGDHVLDATCGNGHDTAFLAKRVIDDVKGYVCGLDLQQQAVEATTKRLSSVLNANQLKRIDIRCCDHAQLPLEIQPESLKLAVYNLGYLPTSDKTIITQAESTVQSLKAVLPLIMPGGAVSLMSYVAHPGGQEEYEALLQFIELLPKSWNVCCHRWVNSSQAPVWLFIQRAKST
jgi:SAM-dependent methyltransferase